MIVLDGKAEVATSPEEVFWSEVAVDDKGVYVITAFLPGQVQSFITLVLSEYEARSLARANPFQ